MSKEADEAKEAEEADGITDVERVRRTARTIFLIFCMKLIIDMINKLTEPDFRKKSQIFFISNFMAKNEVFLTSPQNYSNDFAHFWSECRGEQY